MKKKKIAYLGGSITSGARSTEPAMKSWRALTTAWLRERQPGIEFHEIDASVGGTGSDYACCRMATDVVDHRPDLVFVEFAVNDAQTPALRRHRGYEGVIRSLCRALPEADIIAVHTMGEDFLADYDRGALPGSVACHQRICDHYGVPTINVGDALRVTWPAPANNGRTISATVVIRPMPVTRIMPARCAMRC